MVMLAIPGGEERTEQEYGKLLQKAGFRLTQVVRTDSPVSVVEAVPAKGSSSIPARLRIAAVRAYL